MVNLGNFFEAFPPYVEIKYQFFEFILIPYSNYLIFAFVQ